MLKLVGKAKISAPFVSAGPRTLLRLRASSDELGDWERNDAHIVLGANGAEGEIAVIEHAGAGAAIFSSEYSYLRPGDVVSLDSKSGRFRVLYRIGSRHNSFLVTERCDNYCLMCSQPPKDIDDRWIAAEILEAIPLISKNTQELGFTGGEPTLLGDTFLSILRACAEHLPKTTIHVLSNGRKFSDPTFAEAWAAVKISDLMVGIPIYADVSTVHDYVVQADGAFDETIRGILNLKRNGARVEIRVVLHKQTIGRLVRLAEFIARNLTFDDHVALMGLEITGFTRANLEKLWVDPYDYRSDLAHAAKLLSAGGLRVSIYNHPLCIIEERAWPYAVQSISDWKNEYIRECAPCSMRERCGGFFSSAVHRKSEYIQAIV